MNKEKYILVPCSNRKSNNKGESSDLTKLSFNSQLFDIRKSIVEKYINSDYSFYCDKTKQVRRHILSAGLDWEDCLQASKRYTGIIYSQIDENNWQNANKVLIISPLWGIIKPEDKIPNYSLMMTDRVFFRDETSSIAIWNLWRPALDKILEGLNQNQSNPYTLLFQKCSKGFSSKTRDSFIRPITERNDNYGYNKGIWLNQFLTNN